MSNHHPAMGPFQIILPMAFAAILGGEAPAGDWRPVGWSMDAVFGMDMTSIQTDGQNRKFSSVIARYKQSEGLDYGVATQVIDCAAATIETPKADWFSLTGTLVDSDQHVAAHEIEAGSLQDTARGIICDGDLATKPGYDSAQLLAVAVQMGQATAH